MKQFYYAGVGSRQTPQEVLDMMKNLAYGLGKRNWVLRSGHAPGADLAFEIGAAQANGPREIFIPWEGFNPPNWKHNEVVKTTREAFDLAKEFHPAWERLSYAAQKLMIRNCYQVLGRDLKTPSDCVICWTKDGGPTGGTGQAIRIAEAYSIPVFNLYNYTVKEIVAEIKKMEAVE